MGVKKKIQTRETKEWEKEELDFLKTIGDNLIRLKKEKKLTSKQIYDELEIDKSNYRRIEVGGTNVSILLLKRICKVMGVELKDLLTTPKNKEENQPSKEVLKVKKK